MTIGTSGRIVIEIEPDLKQELHSTLRKDGMNLKKWFLNAANLYLAEKGQLQLDLRSEEQGGADEV